MPCGTPDVTGIVFDDLFSRSTVCVLFDKNESIHLTDCSEMP